MQYIKTYTGKGKLATGEYSNFFISIFRTVIMKGAALFNLRIMATANMKDRSKQGHMMVINGKCSFSRQQQPLESFNKTAPSVC